MKIYSTLTHMNNESGKVAMIKSRDMRTNSQPKHPSLPEFLSAETVETHQVIKAQIIFILVCCIFSMASLSHMLVL